MSSPDPTPVKKTAPARKRPAAVLTEPEPPESLQVVQIFLTEAIQRPGALAQDPERAKLCAVHVSGNERLSPAEQVDVYRRQFWLRHDESMEEDFPALAEILGDDRWETFVEDYLAAHPPFTPSLRDLGASVNQFLETWAGLPPGKEQLCREVARYELAFVDVFDGADPPPLDPARLAQLSPADWERATLTINPLIRRMRFDYAVHRLRLAVRDRKKSGQEQRLDIDAWLSEAQNVRPVYLALFRKECVVHFEDLHADAFRMLEALAERDTLLGACAKVAEGKSEAEASKLVQEVGAWFQRWAVWGFIAAIDV